MKKIYLTIFCLLLLVGCGTKRQYFKPTQVDGKLISNGTLKNKIIDWNLNAAKLDEGVIYKGKGIIAFKLEKNYNLLNYHDGEFITADNDGNLKIFNNAQEEIYAYKFDSSVVSAALDGDDLALILANNTIVLANRSLGIRFSQNLTPAPAQDNRVATPIFSSQLILYPTLDGKLIVFSRNTQKILKEIVISVADFFNNVIYLNAFDDKIIAATSNKLIMVLPHKILHLNAQIKDLIVDKNYIFVLCKDGNIIKTDFELNKIVEKKFEFAIFNKAQIYERFLYIFEKNGYLIKSDLNFENITIFKLEEAVDKMSFMSNGKFYYDNKILDLK